VAGRHRPRTTMPSSQGQKKSKNEFIVSLSRNLAQFLTLHTPSWCNNYLPQF
jgi:hypothetical protein